MSDELAHYGVKGMKWGVRKDDVSGRFQPASSGPKMDPLVHPSSQEAAREVSKLIQDRYGYTVREVKSFGPGDPEYARGTLGYVLNNGKSKPEGEIHVSIDDPRRAMKASEKVGWVAKGCGNPTAFLTHESAHAIFHSREKYDRKGNIVGGNREARIKAAEAMIEEATRSGIKEHQLIGKISGYAAQSGSREEIEAELFSQYHWSTNPPSFVKVWGETLHKEMGIDGTPFKERG
ncbi:hypothetical protein [Streptomyces phage Psst2]|nr:hypothetical protein [Streptomyces phage Psst2]